MVLISILGDFDSSIFPIFFEYKDKITHHIILHDDSNHDKKHIKKLKKAQKDFRDTFEKEGEPYLNYKISQLEVNEDDYSSIESAFKVIATATKKSKDIYLNTTDGLSSISIILSNKVLQYGGNVIAYDRYANTYNIINKKGMKKKKIKNNIDILNHLKLKGYNLKSFTNIFTLKKRKDVIQNLTKNLKDYKQFAAAYPNYQFHHEYYNTFLKEINISKKKTKTFLDGVVFEEYIYWLIKDNIDVDDIMTGVSIEFEKNFRNEIDILIIKDNHLHSIECKFTKNFKGSEYIYKADSIIKHLDDDGKAMILTVSNESPFTNGDIFRAKNNNINIYSVKTFNEEKFLDEIKFFFNLKDK